MTAPTAHDTRSTPSRVSLTELRECPAINDQVPGFAACSLTSTPHTVHQLLCEDTGELLGEWTDADRTFREPANEPRRAIEFSDVA